MDKKILRLLVVALGFLVLLVLGLSILFGLALRDVKKSIQNQQTADIVNAIRSLKVVNGRDGQDGLSIVGRDGRDGKDGADSKSTVVIEQVPIKGDKGDQGDPAPAVRVPIFDGQGNWQYPGDEEWYPLFQPPGVEL